MYVHTITLPSPSLSPSLPLFLSLSTARVKASEEKFVKLREVYTKLRTEHIQLLRTEGEGRKKLQVRSKFMCVCVCVCVHACVQCVYVCTACVCVLTSALSRTDSD